MGWFTCIWKTEWLPRSFGESLPLSDDITCIFKPPFPTLLVFKSSVRSLGCPPISRAFALHMPFLPRPHQFLSRLRGFAPPSWLHSPLHVVIPSTIVGSFKLKITSSRKRFWFKSFITNHLLLAWLSFIWRRLYHPLQVSSSCNWIALLQPNCKRKKKRDVWPSSHGRRGQMNGACLWHAPRSLATFPWGKHVFPKISF